MKKRLILILLLFLFIVGCESNTVVTNEILQNTLTELASIKEELVDLHSKMEEQYKELDALKQEIRNNQEEISKLQNEIQELTGKLVNLECAVEQPYPYLSEKKADCLGEQAKSIIEYLHYGGEGAKFTSDYAKLIVYDPNINTKEKIMILLNEFYTPEISEELYEIFGFHVIDGQMYKKYGELITSPLGELKSITSTEGKATAYYEFDDDGNLIDHEIKFVYIPMLGWRINITMLF